ncbi:MAG TPA: hypothetical protein VMZ73_09345 [Acidimicrobiales bacterium]|nr:hypothetical protein [Acidimicrobiales bacterium]
MSPRTQNGVELGHFGVDVAHPPGEGAHGHANYARRFLPRPSERPRYEADPAEMAALLATSRAPASMAITTAVAQLVANPKLA